MSTTSLQDRGTKSVKSTLLTMIMVTLVSLFAVGCGDSREDYVFTGNNPGATVGNVTFQFDNDVQAQTTQPVPADTAALLFTFYNSQNVAFDNPVLRNYADSVTIEGVPASATSAIVTAIDDAGNAIGTYRFTFTVRAGETVPAVPVAAPPATLATITLAPATVSLNVGQTAQLAADVRLSDGTPATGGTLVYTSSNTTRATVTQAGLVTAVNTGATSIAATYTLGNVSRTATANVVVGNVPIPGNGTLTLQVAGNVTTSVNLNVGQNVTVTALYTPPGASNAVPVTAVGTVANTTVATYLAGVVSGLAAGNTTVNFSYQGANTPGPATASLAVAVNPIAPPGNTVVSAYITSVALNTGSTLRFPAFTGNSYPIVAQVTRADGDTDVISGSDWSDSERNYGLSVAVEVTAAGATFNSNSGAIVIGNQLLANTTVTLQAIAAPNTEFDGFNLETVPLFPVFFSVAADDVDVGEETSYRIIGDLGGGNFQDFTPVVGVFVSPSNLVATAPIDADTGVFPGFLTGVMIGQGQINTDTSSVVPGFSLVLPPIAFPRTYMVGPQT